MLSINQTSAIAYKDFVETYSSDLYTDLFFGYRSATLFEVRENIKGTEVLPKMTIADNITRRWKREFEPPTGTVILGQETLSTVRAKAELSICPQDFESSFLGMFRRKGQNPTEGYSLPFEGFITGKTQEQVKWEMERAVWSAEETATPSANDPLKALFDGWLTKISKGIAATTNPIVPVVTGTISTATIRDQFLELWASAKNEWKDAGALDFFVSYDVYEKYILAYKDKFHHAPIIVPLAGPDYTGITFELGGGKCRIIPVPGMQDSQRIILTARRNFVIGIDAQEDAMWNTEVVKRNVDYWMDFRLGCGMYDKSEGILVVNDQA